MMTGKLCTTQKFHVQEQLPHYYCYRDLSSPKLPTAGTPAHFTTPVTGSDWVTFDRYLRWLRPCEI